MSFDLSVKKSTSIVYRVEATRGERAECVKGWRCPHCGDKLKVKMPMWLHCEMRLDCRDKQAAAQPKPLA